jgi:hypothetical protein
MAIGGFSSVRLQLHFIGTPLLMLGTRLAYKSIIKIVERTKETAKSSDNKIEMLEYRLI